MPTPSFTVLDHPLAGDLLTRLRDRATGPAEYRALTRRLGLLLVAEATRDARRRSRMTVETPLEPFEGTRLARGPRRDPGPARRPRAARRRHRPLPRRGGGLPGHGAQRGNARAARLLREASRRWRAARAGRRSRCSPPAAAASAAVTYVKAAGAADIVFICVVAAPEGLARMQADHPDVPDRGRGARPPAQRQRLHRARPR